MPIFEYRCDDCQKEFEELVTGDENITCPGCKSEKVTKLLSSFAAPGGSTAMTACGSQKDACPSGFS